MRWVQLCSSNPRSSIFIDTHPQIPIFGLLPNIVMADICWFPPIFLSPLSLSLSNLNALPCDFSLEHPTLISGFPRWNQWYRTCLPMQETQKTQGKIPCSRMATHSSILAWKIPWTEESGGLQSMGSKRVRHDWVTERQRERLSPLTRIRLD